MVNINIEINDALHKELKITSVVNNTTLKDYIIHTLDKRLPNPNSSNKRKKGKTGKIEKTGKKAATR